MTKKQTVPAKNKEDVVSKPMWDSRETFLISGIEFEAIAALAQAFEPLISTSKRVLKQAELDGKLKFNYFHPDGSKVSTLMEKELEKERIEGVEKERKMLEEKLAEHQKLIKEQQEILKKQAEKLGGQVKAIDKLKKEAEADANAEAFKKEVDAKLNK